MSNSSTSPDPRRRARPWGNIIGVAVFIAFIAFVELYYGWHALLAPWTRLSPLAIAGAVVVVLLSYGVRAMRLFHYFHAEMRGAYLRCLGLFLQHNVLNNLLPMRSGELSFPMLMSRYFKVPAVRSVPALLWFRMLDFHALAAIALVVTAGWPPARLAGAVAVLWLPVPYLAYRFGGWLSRWLSGVSRGGRLRSLVLKVLAGLPQSPSHFWFAWVWTAVNWVVKLAVFAWVLLLFLDVPLKAAWLAAIAGDLTSVLPVHSVAGAGTFEAGVVAALLPFGVGPDQGLPAAVNLHLFLLGTAVLGGLISLLLVTRRGR